MSPINQEQLDQKKAERKEQIMRAALRVFADNGIKLTKISMIAKEAKVSHGLIYHYFDSKEEILYESIEWAMDQNTVAQFFHSLNASEKSPLEKIKEFTQFAFTESDTGTSSMVFRIVQYLNGANGLPDHIHELVNKSGQFYIKVLAPLFLEGQKSGEIIQGDTEELLGVYLTVLSSIMADDPSYWKENMERKVSILLRMIEVR
ncbi:TetR/AcrR family transcriptional regulator [Gracilibacillus alcaliphilus]|uniref:TetR/AcrR family transcriptional regulator n=1 Tax=Gracilibacillus alcaliphilus TaxID=1401441 RepID=UPI00195A5E17|nr:TetR/AcrR family transcriptional regulator [Gracilibacillus alcaliphilus]MBM7678857.1 AcrR family transcriptional regulator [Gracilibacillus alcaliphilus]